MTIFRLNFLLKVGQMKVCQNPSFISTVMETNLDMNKRSILNFDFNKQITHFIHGYLKVDDQSSNNRFSLNGWNILITTNNITIIEIKAVLFNIKDSYPRFSLIIHHAFLHKHH